MDVGTASVPAKLILVLSGPSANYFAGGFFYLKCEDGSPTQLHLTDQLSNFRYLLIRMR